MITRNIVKEKGIFFRTGYIYNFKYLNYQNDPAPTVIIVNHVKGRHPNTGHYHNYIQGINFSYIPKPLRRVFLNKWKVLMERYKGNVKLTWDRVKIKYPYMKDALRRYYLNKGYIINPIHIKNDIIDEHVEKAIVNDYSRFRLINRMKVNHDLDEIYTKENVSRKFGGLL